MAIVHVVTNLESALPRQAARRERRRLRLSTLARRAGLDPRREPVICQRNGRWVRQRDWHRTLAGANDVVVLRVMPRGGDVGRTVGSIAILIVAAIAAPQLLPVALASIPGVTAATTAALAIGGNYALNALMPPPRVNAPGLSTSLGATDAESPTYAFSLSAQQNPARLGGAIPEWFGYHNVVPDLAATAWWEWAGGKQTLYQTFCCTKGEIDVEAITLGRVPIENFEEITYQVFGPDIAADLFEPEVYQSADISSIELSAPNDLTAPDDGIYGPFPALPPGQASMRIGIDIGFPRGLFLQGGGGGLSPLTAQWRVEARMIDDAGAAIGTWFTVAEETFDADPAATNSSTPESGIAGQFMGGGFATANNMNSPLTVSYRYDLPDAARYEVRLRRLDDKNTSSLAGHDVTWSGLRGFSNGGGYGDVTILQVAIKATASVNAQTARQVHITGTRKLPVYDRETGSWSPPAATRSIAAAASYIIRSENGGAQTDTAFDLETLWALDVVWEDRGDHFDYYATAQRGLWEMLQTALRCGRATAYQQANLIRFFRDQPQSIPVTGFSRENIVQRTLKIDYRLPEPEDDIDGIELKYFDRRTWNFNTLRQAFAGDDTPLRPESRTLDGCIEEAQAQRELDYYIADRRLRAITVSFDAEMEGGYPSYGDLILFSHDAPKWGISNRILSWDAETLTAGMFSPPVWTFGEGWYARIRDVRGRYSAPVLVASAPGEATITLDASPTYDDGSPFDFTLSDSELLHVMLGQAEDAPRLALFREMTPRGGGRVVSCKAVLEDQEVHVN